MAQVKALASSSLPFLHSIDNHLNMASKNMGGGSRKGGGFNCLWAMSPIAWEDPGTGGDGLEDAVRIEKAAAANKHA